MLFHFRAYGVGVVRFISLLSTQNTLLRNVYLQRMLLSPHLTSNRFQTPWFVWVRPAGVQVASLIPAGCPRAAPESCLVVPWVSAVEAVHTCPSSCLTFLLSLHFSFALPSYTHMHGVLVCILIVHSSTGSCSVLHACCMCSLFCEVFTVQSGRKGSVAQSIVKRKKEISRGLGQGCRERHRH